MARARQFVIARDGWWPIALSVTAAVAAQVYVSPWLSIPPLLLAAYCVVYYRNPHRVIPTMPHGVLSPLDGVVESVSKSQCHYLDREAYCIRVRRERFGSYFIRSPIEGKVRELDADHRPQDGFAWQLDNDEGDSMVVIMSADSALARHAFRPRYGERIGQGQRSGTRHLGRVAELWLPTNARVLVKEGQRVKSGSDVLAKLVHK